MKSYFPKLRRVDPEQSLKTPTQRRSRANNIKRFVRSKRWPRRFNSYVGKMRGTPVQLPQPNYKYVLWSWLGAFLAIATTGYSSAIAHAPMLIAPFGATCVLAFAAPESPLAQPRNIIGGHCLATLIGLTCLHVFGSDAWVMALAVATAIGCMQLTHTLHPPAGADPLVIIMTGASWKFFWTPVFTGSILLVLCAVVFNNLADDRKYPKYWL